MPNEINPEPHKRTSNLLDVRSMPHPEPMLRILEATTTLSPGDILTVVHNRIPHLLYPRLAERGFTVETKQEQENGVVLLTIRHQSIRT